METKKVLCVCYINKGIEGSVTVAYERIVDYSETQKMFRSILFSNNSRCPTRGKSQLHKDDILKFVPGWYEGSPSNGAVYFWEGDKTKAKSVLLKVIQERALQHEQIV